MNENSGHMNASQKPARLKNLVEQLSALDTGEEAILPADMDMLSLIISGTLNEENIAQRYPGFYQKLLENAALRQAFLDALESVEAERTGELVPLPGATHPLDFLTRQPSAAVIEIAGTKSWRATWQRTLEQLQAVFSPPEIAYRAGNADVEDPWFTLLRDEMTTGGVTYDILLDCTLSSEKEGALSTFLNLAVTLGKTGKPAGFPLRASLQWGDYEGSVLVTEEGRFRFPDIPVASVFNAADSQPQAGFSLSLEMAS